MVLVADDEPDVLALVAVTLELEGHEVITANDGADAVRKAVAEPPDVAVIDVMMPNVDGLTAVRQLRAGPRTKTIPILLLSAKAGAMDIEVGMRAGASAYLTKPFDTHDLVAAVARLIR